MYSGGERKRIDLALMFAIHDLHVNIYGRQCNIQVFDEVDGRLDEDGVYKFMEVLNANFVDPERPSPILVISHKNEMRDAFPQHISVMKKDGFSTII